MADSGVKTKFPATPLATETWLQRQANPTGEKTLVQVDGRPLRVRPEDGDAIRALQAAGTTLVVRSHREVVPPITGGQEMMFYATLLTNAILQRAGSKSRVPYKTVEVFDVEVANKGGKKGPV